MNIKKEIAELRKVYFIGSMDIYNAVIKEFKPKNLLAFGDKSVEEFFNENEAIISLTFTEAYLAETTDGFWLNYNLEPNAKITKESCKRLILDEDGNFKLVDETVFANAENLLRRLGLNDTDISNVRSGNYGTGFEAEFSWDGGNKEVFLISSEVSLEQLKRASDIALIGSEDECVKLSDLLTQCNFKYYGKLYNKRVIIPFDSIFNNEIERLGELGFNPIDNNVSGNDKQEYHFKEGVIEYIKTGDTSLLEEVKELDKIENLTEKAYELKIIYENDFIDNSFKNYEVNIVKFKQKISKQFSSDYKTILEEINILEVEKCSCCGAIMLPDDECYTDYTNSDKPICDSCALYDEDKEVYYSDLTNDEVLLNEIICKLSYSENYPTYREFKKMREFPDDWTLKGDFDEFTLKEMDEVFLNELQHLKKCISILSNRKEINSNETFEYEISFFDMDNDCGTPFEQFTIESDIEDEKVAIGVYKDKYRDIVCNDESYDGINISIDVKKL